MNYTVSEENYIKAIYHLQGQNDTVGTNALAQELNTRPASVTDMMKKLKAKKLLNYEPYKGFRLSSAGSLVALNIIRRHRLWEFFLSEKLHFEWNEVHEIAEHLEHVSSPKLIDKLDEYLGFPKFDPHGDPIPDSGGRIPNASSINLANAPLNQPLQVCQVSNQSPQLLELLNHMEIGLGTLLIVRKHFAFDNSLELSIEGQDPVTVSEALAKNIWISHES